VVGLGLVDFLRMGVILLDGCDGGELHGWSSWVIVVLLGLCCCC
jgi:hypothetical protein